tara:strand:+ start:15 stop:452 length:438 start_codon:yes stop_codon:yes gene_type:complete
MSGIIGGAGSRSGIIGYTEIAYEEGIWTPASQEGTLQQDNSMWYRRMGTLAWFGASVKFQAGLTTTNNQKITGLPFSPVTYSPGYVGYTDWGSTDEPHLMIVVWNALNYANFYKTFGSSLTGANLAGSRVDFTLVLNIDGPWTDG